MIVSYDKFSKSWSKHENTDVSYCKHLSIYIQKQKIDNNFYEINTFEKSLLNDSYFVTSSRIFNLEETKEYIIFLKKQYYYLYVEQRYKILEEPLTIENFHEQLNYILKLKNAYQIGPNKKYYTHEKVRQFLLKGEHLYFTNFGCFKFELLKPLRNYSGITYHNYCHKNGKFQCLL